MKLYRITTETGTDVIAEFWGSSTKHPDQTCSMNEDIARGHFTKTEYFAEWCDVFQWLLLIASKKQIPMHAWDCATDAIEFYTKVTEAIRSCKDPEDKEVAMKKIFDELVPLK